jgi:hypothetical protein
LADFGDFTSAAIKPSPPSLTAGSPREAGGDFADFQSAFGASLPKHSSAPAAESVQNGLPFPSTAGPPAAEKSDDLLGLSFDMGGSSTAPSGNNASLLSEDLFSNSAAQQTNFQPTNSVGFAPFPSSSMVTPPMQSPSGQFTGGFPSMGSLGGFSSMAAPVVPSQPQSLPMSQPVSSPSLNFGGDDLLAPVMEPAKSANGSIANSSTSNNNNNNMKPSLQV